MGRGSEQCGPALRSQLPAARGGAATAGPLAGRRGGGGAQRGALADARELLADLASFDLPALLLGQALDGDALARLSGARQRNAVRAWLGRLGLPLPDSVHLQRIVGELRAARDDAAPVVGWPGAEVRRYRAQLHAMPPLAPPPSAVLRWDLRRSRRCALGGGLGELVLVPDAHGPLSRGTLPRVLEIGFRVGGERLQLADGGPRRRLKEWLRAQAVLPWMRTRLPLLRAAADGALVAVADLAVAAPYARRAARDGCRIEWRGAPTVRSTVRPAAAHNDPRLLRTCDSS
ncbi:MAG: tRNA lysidine(34) synthetase TilS [Steroidobacteraceae bacterium]